MPTLAEVVEDARVRLLKAGVRTDEARLDAELLARHVLGWDRAQFIASRRQILPATTARSIDALVRRRERREPLAYVVGTREFYGRMFRVDRRVLVPRPETEAIVEEALGLARTGRVQRNARIADVGCGSGCIGISLALEMPESTLVAIDIDADALALARANSATLGAAGRVGFVQSDLLSGTKGPFDVVVSNPPYVPEGERETLQAEVREFEPSRALFGGVDGLDVVRRLIRQAADVLTPGGWLIVELGIGQAAAVESALAATLQYGPCRFVFDLQGVARVCVTNRSAS